ncbi:MAG: F0F1 ATP synthase subunit A [Lachnospiraceae bacterium]|jgi:ATP synthase subunit a|nr:F0F1 ATP synthase subunit A [Lachnospiraceae bacterium]
MEKLARSLLEELNVETVFTIPLFGGIPVSESVVVTWIAMAVLIVIAFLLGRNLKVRNPGKRQQIAELIVLKLDAFTKKTLGEEATEYSTYMAVVLLFIGFVNLIGVFGFKPPTKDLNVPAALALMSIVLVEVAGIRAHGTGGWLKGFAKPMVILTPINILEIFIRPLSLCMRLFGNVLGAFVIMELVKLVVPVGVPAILSLYFDVFDGLIQAYVFVFLTSLYISEAVE